VQSCRLARHTRTRRDPLRSKFLRGWKKISGYTALYATAITTSGYPTEVRGGGWFEYQGGIKYDIQLSPSGPYVYPLTEVMGFDYRDPYWLNNGDITLEVLGTVVARGTLPPYSGGAGGAAVDPQSGLWWNPDESGSGYAVDYRHGVLVVTIYSYLANEDPIWYLASGPVTGSAFAATLDRYRGGQCISCGYRGRPTLIGNDGNITLQFQSATSATMTLPGGRSISIEPQPF